MFIEKLNPFYWIVKFLRWLFRRSHKWSIPFYATNEYRRNLREAIKSTQKRI